MDKYSLTIFITLTFSFSNCQKENSYPAKSSPLRKINLQTFLNSAESKKFSIELAKGKIDVNVLNVPKLPRQINFVLRQDDCAYYVIRGNLQLKLAEKEPIFLEREEVLFVPAGVIHSISSSVSKSKILMIKSSNESEIEYLD
ncbi:cupin domain-containing protein [Leptospira sp. 201903070]|uniref:Cupin domain-containing protein n=1 Tax=Leptospira ainlahdjerensis TaxID=2810033 RepID=A0ABS2U646_9LEPT|nr:cupin domain-containing protein [Leptospira ainlahdjerensis]MBM9575842.1 cupin domain-containing protein [Leptospira ainlahdjerensis]